MATPIAVTIAGSDSGGGAGIQADLKTFSALGVYGASVIAALTAQNTRGVTAIHDVPAEFITAQIDAVFSDLSVGAVKIGMLSRPAAIEAVASGVTRYGVSNVVLDPVMVAGSGDRLLAEEAVAVLRSVLIPKALVITPNLPEAAALLDASVAQNEDEMRAQAQRLLALGPRAVLIKGGHGKGSESVDLLVEAPSVYPSPASGGGKGGGEVVRLTAERIPTHNTHGTGCTLSSAVAAGLAKGESLADAVRHAKRYITDAIAAADALAIGHGRGPVHHIHAWWTCSS
jgi:hydroxymethylpyrimidine/phosphomethylpyrimidine kinase